MSNNDTATRAAIVPLAETFGIGTKAAERVHQEIGAAVPDAVQFVLRSTLPDEMRTAYAELLRERSPA